MNNELLIIGGGLASARAIAAYRDAGGRGRIALVSKDEELPYHRPPLSKRYLRGEQDKEDALVADAGFYAEHGVDLFLRTNVTGVDTDARRVETADGRSIAYKKLLIASGAVPRRLDVPGAELGNVFTLRTLADSTRIREAAGAARSAVVVGAGFVGMEVAASLRQLGLAVTIVHRGQGLFDQLRVPELSAALARLYAERGVEVVFGDEVAELEGGERVERVLTQGGRSLDAELVVAGVGVVPAVDFLAGSALEVDNGVVVDERLEASVPGVYAVGDVAAFYDPVLGRRRRIEHWSNANYQGTQVGKTLAGADGTYDAVSSFFTEVFGTTLKVFGDSAAGEPIAEGSFEEARAVARYFAGDRLVGALTVGQEAAVESALKDDIRAAAQATVR